MKERGKIQAPLREPDLTAPYPATSAHVINVHRLADCQLMLKPKTSKAPGIKCSAGLMRSTLSESSH